MTGAELKTYFENLIEDTHDITHTYQLFSMIKNKIERRVKPPFLENVDSTQTRSAGDTYTSMKTLPTDFRTMLEIYLGSTTNAPLREIPFKHRIRYKDTALRYYIDYKNDQFAITGTAGKNETIHQIYLIKTEDFTEANEDDDILTWPEEFHPIIPFFAAELYQGNIDPDDIAVRQSIAQNVQANDLLDEFIVYLAEQKVDQQDGRAGFDENEDEVEADIALL